MKLLHTADWHLGKTLKRQSLIDDQKFIIDEIFRVIDKRNVDTVIIAGDVYDRAVPSVEAVNLFDETLTKFVERNLQVLIIAGNHDSAARLNFGSKLFESKKIFIATRVEKNPKPVKLEDDFGEIYFSLIPFFDSGDIHAKFFDEDAEPLSTEEATKFYLDKVRQEIPDGKRRIAVAHAFISGVTKTESVRDIVGCAEGISAEIFSGYNYVALGHIHGPRSAGKNLRYSGSPLKYSFDEADQEKGVTFVEIDGAGNVTTENISLPPRRNVVVVKGSFAELLKRSPIDDYAQIILTDEIFIPEAADRLRAAFPHLLDFKYEKHLTSYEDNDETDFRKDAPIAEQFANFFNYMTGNDLNAEERAAFEEILLEVEHGEAEK